jgi:hypothetical protein
MPRSRHKSAQIVRTASPNSSAVAVDLEPRLPPLHESLVLTRATAKRLNDFQRAHVEYPPISPYRFRTIRIPIIEPDLSPVMRHGKPLRTLAYLEVADQEYTRHPHWGMRPRPLWYFLVWNMCGVCLYKARRRSRAGATRLYRVPAYRLCVVRTDNEHRPQPLCRRASRRARQRGQAAAAH